MTRVALTPPDPRLTGRWTRSLLVSGTGDQAIVDTTTDVTWLQAGSLFVDLRLPVPSPAVDLTQVQKRNPAENTTSGFAGRLLADGPWARWERLVDVSPPTGSPDEGALHDHGTHLVETGRHGSYVEHWHRSPAVATPVAALLLRERTTGAPAVLVRVGGDLGWARGHPAPAPTGAGPVVDEDALDLADAEVAIGRLTDTGVVLERANLPWRRGALLTLWAAGDDVHTAEQAPHGGVVRHCWEVLEIEGDLADLPVTAQGACA